MCMGNGINHCLGFGQWTSGEMLMLGHGWMTVGVFLSWETSRYHMTQRGDSPLILYDSMQLSAVWLTLTGIYMTHLYDSWTLDLLWLTVSVYKLLCSRETALSSSSCWIQVVLEALDQTRAACSRNPQRNIGFRKAATRTRSLLMTWCTKSLRITQTRYGSSSNSTWDTWDPWESPTFEMTLQPVSDIKMSLTKPWHQSQIGDMWCSELSFQPQESSKFYDAHFTSKHKVGIASLLNIQQTHSTMLVDKTSQEPKYRLPGHPTMPNW